MNLKDKPYSVYVPRYWGKETTFKLDPKQCQVSVYSNDRSLSFHQCSKKAKEVADLYSDDVPRPTCGTHIAAVERRAKKEEEHAKSRETKLSKIEEDKARVEAALEKLGINDGFLITNWDRKTLLSHSTGKVSISLEELERIANR